MRRRQFNFCEEASKHEGEINWIVECGGHLKEEIRTPLRKFNVDEKRRKRGQIVGPTRREGEKQV